MDQFKSDLSFSVVTNNFNLNDQVIIVELCKFIIRYPLIWYYYTKQILAKNLIYFSEYNSLIIYYHQLSAPLKQTVNKIISFLQENKALKKKIINHDIIILYLYNQYLCNALSNNKVWLRYLTHYTLSKIITNKIYDKPVLNTHSGKHQYDLMFIKNDMKYLILCEFQKNIVWHQFVKNNIFLIFITLEDIQVNLPIVKYNYNFEQFKSDLLSLLVRFDILEMFYF